MALSRSVFLLLALLPLAMAQTTYPNCPLTGQQPHTPTVPPNRCPMAATASCCTDCYDLNYAIQALSANVTAIVDSASGGMAASLGLPPNFDVCGLFYGKEMCEQMVEQIVCATSCNPDSGNYMTVTSSTTNLNVCPGFAQQLYDACGKLTFGGFVVSDLLYTPADIFSQVINKVVQVAIPNFNSTITSTNCFNGPDVMPSTPLCCDPLNVPSSCPTGAVNTSVPDGIIGRTPNGTYCADYPYSTTTVPFEKAPITAPAPGSGPAPGPTPPTNDLAPSSGAAPTMSPPTAPPPSTTPPGPPTTSNSTGSAGAATSAGSTLLAVALGAAALLAAL